MKLSRKSIFLLVIVLEISGLIVVSGLTINSKLNDSSNIQAQAEDLTVTIEKDQFYFKNDTVKSNAYIYWAELEGGQLTIYGNTSDMYQIEFWDGIGNLTQKTEVQNGDYEIFPDRIAITIRTTELYYQIRSNYYPDYFLDTNFIVIFDTFWAQFSYLTPEGEERYAPVNYHNRQLLPEGAGIVSYAPTDGAIIVKEGNSFGIVWEYSERAMDPFHEPLTYEITYNFDPIYLQFTEQMFNNQQQQQEKDQIDNLIDLLKTYFKLITYFAIVLSLIAALLGYLRAKRKFKSRLNEARNMPKKMLKDIEKETDPGKRVSSMFSVLFLVLILSSALHQGDNLTEAQDVSYLTNDRQITIEDYSELEASSENILYDTSIDLGKDGIAYETVTIELPYTIDNFSIWVDTTTVLDFRAYNSLGAPVSYQEFTDHFLIRNVQGYVKYEIVKPYVYYNNSNILVYIDYFWLLFVDEEAEEEDIGYLKADIDFTIVVPDGAILYSASPEDILTLSQTPEGRRKVSFSDTDRQIDPYHELFSTQVTFSYIDVIEAIENQSARFEHFQVDIELTTEQIIDFTRNLIFISLLGLIAPILSFLLTYFIMRRRMMRKIKEEEQKHEMLISVEEIQLRAMKDALKIDISKEPWKAMLGEYWELLSYLSRFTPVNMLGLNEEIHEKTVRKYLPSMLISETLELLSVGKALSDNWKNEEQIHYTRHQARDYLESVMKLIEKTEKWRKENS